MWIYTISDADRDAGEHVTLTDTEKMVLADVNFAGDRGLTVFELGDSRREAGQSIGRFGLLTAKSPREVRSAGAVYVVSAIGAQRLAVLKARQYPCCEFAIRLNCVCRERTYCPEHGGGCHGTHD